MSVDDFSLAGASGHRLRVRTSVRLLPIVFIVAYLSFSVWLFAFGPWTWPIDNPFALYFFLTCAHFSLLLGYLSAAFGKPLGYRGKWSVKQLVTVSLAVNLLLLLPTSAFRTGSAIPNVIQGINNPGDVYFSTNAMREGGGPVEYIRIVLGPLLWLLLPLTVFYWQRLRWFTRILALTSVLGFVAIYVAIGTNKAVADFMLITPCLVVASACARHFRLTAVRVAGVALVSGLLAWLFFLFFTNGQLGRLGSRQSIEYLPSIGLSANADNVLLENVNPDVQLGIVGLSAYVTQGYYGLSLALHQPFVPMFGVGNSMFLYFNAVKVTGNENIEQLPYPVRVERAYGWKAYLQWDSIYPWLASDFSFPGTVLLVFLIGRLFAMSWLDTVRGDNPFAVAMLAQFILMFFYFPANNQMLQTGEALTSFYGTLALWLITRRRSPSARHEIRTDY
jgi:hypothetical protein